MVLGGLKEAGGWNWNKLSSWGQGMLLPDNAPLVRNVTCWVPVKASQSRLWKSRLGAQRQELNDSHVGKRECRHLLSCYMFFCFVWIGLWWPSLTYFFIEIYFMCPFKVYNLVFFSIFIKLYNYHHYLIPDYVHQPRRNLVPFSYHLPSPTPPSLPLALGNH